MASASITSPGPYPVMLAGHSGRLKYADARDLPSYPSPGLRPGDAAASAAATRGWASTPVSPAFQNQPSTPRSQDALLAAGWAQRQKQPSLPPPSLWGSTAANLAFKAGKPPPSATVEPQELSRQNSMHAAKGAMGGLRPRARSSPQALVVEEDAADTDRSNTTAATHALNAATIAHRPSMRAASNTVGDAGAVPITTMNRQMFTSHPPVKPETDEKNRADVLHASALAMAKKMYDQQQRIIDNSARAHARSASLSGAAGEDQQQQPTPMVYTSLQEAAYRQAQERLAKLQQEHDQQRSLQEYYSTPSPQPHPQRSSKLGTIKGKLLTRRRSSSDGDVRQLEDRRRSEQIRKQMSLLSTQLSAVDEDKRARDRTALLAAAQRNVRAQLLEMDEKNLQQQQQSGRPAVAMDDWGRKALVAAQARFDAGSYGGGNAGKVDIGGGKMMERAEVERIAALKVQPVLDEINERAEKEQARQEEERLDAERRREEAERERMREREIEGIHRQLKEQQKEDERARKAEVKQEEKNRKEEAKAIKAEQKHAAKEEKHKDKEAIPPPPTTTAETEESSTPAAQERERKRLSGMSVRHVRALSINFPKRPPRTPKGKNKDAAAAGTAGEADDNATSPTRKVRAWLLSRFPRPRAKSAAAEGGGERHDDAHDNTNNNNNAARGFIGGVALARLQGKNPSASSVDAPNSSAQQEALQQSGPDSSMHEVAMAGRQPVPPLTAGDEPGESSGSAALATTAATTTATRDFSTPAPTTANHAPPTPRTPPPRVIPAATARPTSQVSDASVPLSASERSVSSLSSSLSSEEEEGGQRFVMARSEQPGTAGLTPPQFQPRTAVPMVMAGRVSPFRESRFSEILE